MTIYAMYERNGNRAGFWAQHRTWANACVLVRGIAGRASGPLPSSPPAHEPTPVQSLAFDVRSGRPLPSGSYPFDPGDRAFVPIAAPPWAHARRGALPLELETAVDGE